MLIPTLVFDNFFKNPKFIVDYAKKLEYKPAEKGEWPGGRSEFLHVLDETLFKEVTSKIIKLIWPSTYQDVYFTAKSMFQTISSDYVNEGWIHRDPDILTAIIYLSKHEECGTSIFEQKSSNFIINIENKKEAYLTKNFKKEKKFLKENNNNFRETISVKSKYNRIMIFDSLHLHGAKNFCEKDIDEDRLTLVTFFTKIYGPGVSWHGPECIRT